MRYYFHLRIGRELSPDEIGLDLPDLDTAYLEAFQAARAMWSELLAERSDPMLRSFEIADSDGRVLLLLPFREVLESARKPRGRMPNEVRSAHALLEKTRNLTETLREEIKAAQAMIEATRRSMQQTRRVLDRSPPAVNRGRNGA
jgi:hypothetical protein